MTRTTQGTPTSGSGRPAAERAAPEAPGTGAASTRRTATADLVLEIATATGGERELDQILGVTLSRLRTVVPLTGGSIALVDGNDLVVRAAVGPFAETALGQRVARGGGPSWGVVETRRPFLTGDLQAAGLRIRTPGAEQAIRSWLAVPIVRRDEGIGLLEIDSTRPNAFGQEDVALLDTVARALAGPIDLAWRYAAEQQASRLRDAFIGVISHELRTPITTIYGASKLLRRRELKPENRDQALEDIEAEADRLRRLIEDLLVLSRAQGGRLQLTSDPVLVAHVVPRVVSEEAPRWPEHRFQVVTPTVLPLIFGEETAIEQVVRNLVTNSAKYSPPGTGIDVVAETDSDEVIVRVLDEGIGVSAEECDRLFDLFYRTREATRRAPGAGIGLFVCRALVDAMGGRMWGRPRAEGGSEFGFALPVANPEVEPF